MTSNKGKSFETEKKESAMIGSASFGDIFTREIESDFNLSRSNFDYPRILITGSNGMLGNALAVTLDNIIYEQSLRCDLFLASRIWPEESISRFRSSPHLLNNIEVRSKKYDFDLIVHCASPSNVTKIEGYLQLADINRGFLEDCISENTKKVVFISTGEVYKGGETKIGPMKLEEISENKRDWYPLAKIDCENYLSEVSSASEISVDILRLFHTFGPGISRNDGRSFSDILYSASDKKRIELKSDGSQVRSFLYLADAISAILLCLEEISEFRVFNIGSPHQFSIMEFAKLVGNATDSDVIVKKSQFDHSPFDVIVPDISETLSWGWKPIVDIRDSINLTLNWIKRQKI